MTLPARPRPDTGGSEREGGSGERGARALGATVRSRLRALPPATPPPLDKAKRYVTVERPNLFVRSWRLVSDATTVGSVDWVPFYSFRIETTQGRFLAHFERGQMTVAETGGDRHAPRGFDRRATWALRAVPWAEANRKGARLLESDARVEGEATPEARAWILHYRAREDPYDALDDALGPCATFGRFQGGGFAAEAKVAVAARLGDDERAPLLLCAALLLLKERPGRFARTGRASG